MSQTFETQLGGRTLTIETGKLARLAGGSVTVRYGDTMVLGTANRSEPRPGLDFFPLTVDFEERMYAAGKIPGGFIKRESRPSENAILAARQTDRPIRPLFPKGYKDDVQLVITVLSTDQENNPDVIGTIAASAALTISEIPFNGPVGAVRVGRIDGEFVVNPTYSQLKESELDLIVAGTRDAIMMVEAGANLLPEDVMAEAILFGHRSLQPIIDIQEQIQKAVGKAKRVPYIEPSTGSVLDFASATDAKRELVVIDVETTGTDPKMSDLVEIAAVKIKGTKVVDTLVDVREPRPRRSSATRCTASPTRTSRARRARRRRPSSCWTSSATRSIVGHNVGFDLGFIEEAKGDGFRFAPGTYLDTLVIAREGYPGAESYKLGDLAALLRHRARARATAPCRTPRRPPTSCCGSRTTCRVASRSCATSIADAVRAQRTGGDTQRAARGRSARRPRQQEPLQPHPEEDRPPASSSTRASGSTAAA